MSYSADNNENGREELRPAVSEDGYKVILIDEPAEGIRRITLNRPDKRNALNHQLRGEVLHALQAADSDPNVKVMHTRPTYKKRD